MYLLFEALKGQGVTIQRERLDVWKLFNIDETILNFINETIKIYKLNLIVITAGNNAAVIKQL